LGVVLAGAAKLMIAAQLLVITTLFTVGAFVLTEFKISKVPLIAGSKNSRLSGITRYEKGDAVWMTVSKGGVDWTTSSNAPDAAVSGTISKPSCDPWLGKSERTCLAFASLRTMPRTEWPRERSWSSVHHNIHNTILPNIGGPQYHRGVRVLYYPQYAIPHIVLLTIY
jgi:hypothetical protein